MSTEDHAPRAPYIADLVNHLFQTRLSPRGYPWTLREVSRGTGGRVSIGYLSELRQGRISDPSLAKVGAIARFFGVDLDDFLLESAQASPRDQELRRALAEPLVPQIALYAAELDLQNRDILLQQLRTQTAPLRRPGRPRRDPAPRTD